MSETQTADDLLTQSQHKAAKVAGLLYLLTVVTANFTEFYVRGRLMVPSDALQTATNIAVSGRLFRIGIASDLLTLPGSVVLLVALYVVLKPVNRAMALLAGLWWLVECSIGAAVASTDFASLLLLSGTDHVPAFNADQLQAWTRFFISLDAAGNRIGAVFFGLGSIVFCYLWFKSRYIPRWLAGLGIIASLLPIVVQLSAIVFPTLLALHLRRARSGVPIVIFEVILGLWLLIKGIRTPATE